MLPVFLAFSLFGGQNKQKPFIQTLAGEWTIVQNSVIDSETKNYTLNLVENGESLMISGELKGEDVEGEIVTIMNVVAEMEEDFIVIKTGEPLGEQEIFRFNPIKTTNGANLAQGKSTDGAFVASFDIPNVNTVDGVLVNTQTKDIIQLTCTKKVVQNKGSLIQQFLPMIIMMVMQTMMKRKAPAQGGAAPAEAGHQKKD